MTQLSRPFQIALVALGLLVLVWFVALRGHTSSTGGSSGSSAGSSASGPTSTPSAAAQAKSAAAPTPIYRGPVPGLQGLSRAINKAHGAVAQSQREAKRVETSEPSSSSSSSSSSSAASSAGAGTPTKSASSAGAGTPAERASSAGSGTPAKHASSAASTSRTAAGARGTSTTSAAKPGARTAPAMQSTVERELRQDKTVLILFWNPRGADDVAVHREVPAVQRALGASVAVHYAQAVQVGSFGKITSAVHVNQTPTLLIVNTRGQTTTLTGLTDAFSIEQAVAESRRS